MPMAPPVLVWMMMSLRLRISSRAAANTWRAWVGFPAASRTCRWNMEAPASRQRAASAPISAAVTGRAGCAALVVSAPTPATVMMSLSTPPPLRAVRVVLRHEGQALFHDLEGAVQVGLGVAVADVPVMIRLDEQAAADALRVELRAPLLVVLVHVVEGQERHRRDAALRDRHAALVDDLTESREELRAALPDRVLHLLALEDLEALHAGRHLEAVGEEGRAEEGVLLVHAHDLALADQRRDGVAVGHRLADRREVGHHAVALAGAAHADAEARADLVKRQHGAVLVRQLLAGLQVPRRRPDDRLGHRVADRRDDDAGDLAGVLLEHALQRGDVAVLELLGELPHGLRDAAVMLHAPVAPAVVAAAGDLVAARVGARGADRGVGGIRARLDEDGLLAAGHDSASRCSSSFCSGCTRLKQKPLSICAL